MDGNTPRGGFLYLIWALEALTVIGGITYTTVKSTAGMLFCEESNMWVTKKDLLGVFSPITNINQTRLDVAQGNLSALNDLSPAKPNSTHFSLLEIYECDHCKNFRVLNLDDGTVVRDRKGRVVTKTQPIIKNLMISSMAFSNLKRMIEEKRIASLDQKA